MINKEKKIVFRNLRRLFICALFLFFLFVVPKIDINKFLSTFLQLIKPDLSRYPYLNPPIFLSIGEALSSVAILFAIYQFKKEKWDISFKIRNYIEPVVFFGVSSGVISAIIASILPLKNPTNIFQLSIFWQILSSVLIVFSITFLLLKVNNKSLFNKKNSQRFYEIMIRELSRPNPERLDAILDVLLDNFDDICKLATTELNESAIKILNEVLSEYSLVDILTTKRLDALQYILLKVEEYHINRRHSSVGIPKIIQNLFIDKESFFYKQIDTDGLALSSNIYEIIFGSPIILSNFDVFGYPTLSYSMREKIGTMGTSVFIEALSYSIKTYLKTGRVPARRINEGLSYISGIFNNVCLKISNEEKRGVDDRNVLASEWNVLYSIANFLGHDYLFLVQKENANEDVVNKEEIASEADFNSESAINEGIAAALYGAFESLSCIKKDVDVYHVVLDLFFGMIYESDLRRGYRAPFEKRMWEQIGRNIIHKHYPATLRIYLVFIGFCLASNRDQRQEWIGEQSEKMRRLLYIDLKPLLDKDAEMINKEKMKDVLLPQLMDYKSGMFTYKFGFGRGEEKIISAPEVGAKSVIEGISLKHI